MADIVAILEDDPGRIAEMRAILLEELPHVQAAFFENANEMITWLGDNAGDVILISLDHDLPLRDRNGQQIECGTGRQVADYLAKRTPTCPIIIHTSNEHFAPGMFFTLKDAGWPVKRVYPRDDLAWIRGDWGGQIRQYVLEGWIVVQGT